MTSHLVNERADVWSQKAIDLARQKIRSQIESQNLTGEPRLKYILDQIVRASEESPMSNHPSEYIWVVYALLHHQRYGGLKPSQVQRLLDKGLALLQVKNVSLTSQRLSYLYGDLRLLMSQIYRSSGHHFSAAWEHQMSTRLYRKSQSRDKAFQSMGRAVRSLRCGDALAAIQQFENVGPNRDDPSMFSRARISKIKALRLAGRIKDAETEIKQASLEIHESDLLIELSWESICLTAIKTKCLRAMVNSCKKKGIHALPIYQLECILWTRAASALEWRKCLPTLENLRRSNEGFAASGFLYKCVATIEQAYENEWPFEYRLDRLGKILARRSRLISIDLELLMLAASVRWLARRHAFGLASVPLSEYAALCTRLSGTHNLDPLNVVTDLTAKEWFTEFTL